MSYEAWSFDKKRLGFVLVLIAALLFFLNSHRTVKVTPANETAVANRMVDFKYYPGTDKGKVKARMKSGERLVGEYQLVRRQDEDRRADEEGVYDLGDNSMNPTEQYRRLRDMTLGARDSSRLFYRGVLEGDRGTRVFCEYYFSPLGNDGVGACESSDGGRHRVVF